MANMKNIFILLPIILLVSSCATTPTSHKIGPQKYLCGENGIEHFARNYTHSEANKYAKKSFKFAMMASNVNNNGEPRYEYIPGWSYKEEINSWTYFKAEVYESNDGKIAIAFKGTDGIIGRDMLFGNILGVQYIQADNFLKLTNKKYPNAKEIIVVGHSLGGAMALYVSKFEPTDKINEAYLFSHPPVGLRLISEPLSWIFNLKKIKNGKTEGIFRYRISEDGEILNLLRIDTQEFDIQDNNWFVEHSIYKLSRGLLMIAASKGDEDAKDVLENIGCGTNSP